MENFKIPLQRLYNQQIIQSSFQKPEQVISWMGAIQGQDFPGAKWSIGLRLNGSKDSDVEKSFSEHRIVRLWLMRGTLHIIAAKDIRWMRELFATRIIRSNTRRYAELELDSETLLKTNDILDKTLADNKQFSRRELLDTVNQKGISTKGQRAAYILQRAAYDGIICQSAMYKNEPQYFHQSVLKAQLLSKEEALAELTMRYFKSRGPATMQDFAWWSGLTVKEAKAGIAEAKLTETKINDQSYWMNSENTMRDSGPSVFLLPGFDEYLLGYKDRNLVLDPAHSNFWCPGGNGMFHPVIVIDGVVAGTWKKIVKKGLISVETSFFNPQASEVKMKIATENYKSFIL